MIELVCPACSQLGQLKYKSNIESSRITSDSFSSRKTPELMHGDLYLCNNCQTLFTERVESSWLLKAYSDAPLNATAESFAAAATYERLVKKELLSVPRTVLDIGCGDGAFLSRMVDAGTMIAHGVEPSRAASEKSSDHRVKIQATTLSELDGCQIYDAVCLFQTIEHVTEPRELIDLMIARLSKSGSLFIVCHDRKSITNRLLGRRSPIFDIEHLQLFTQRGLRHLLESRGLRIITMKRFVNHYPLNYALRLLIPKANPPSWSARVNVRMPAGNLFVRATHK